MKIPLKDDFYRDFLLFVFQLSWFKTYPHADAKQRKTKKWPNVPIHNFLYVEINVRMTSILVSSFSKPCDQKVVSSNPARAGRVKHKTLK
jgi:hypothetical protein